MTETQPALRRSTDRKVTNAIRVGKNGTTVSAIGANSFGLPSGTAFSCPGQTEFCKKICYAGKLETIYAGVRNILLNNWNLVKDATLDEMVELLDVMVIQFELETVGLIAKGKNASLDFRIHWDGDFFSRDYAKAWADVIRRHPSVRFWVYTRSFVAPVNVIDIIAGIDNLTVYLSADSDNVDEANAIASQFPGILIATVAPTFADARETITDNSRKVYPCPESGKRIPLISTKGSACIACGICPAGRGDVLFSVKKR